MTVSNAGNDVGKLELSYIANIVTKCHRHFEKHIDRANHMTIEFIKYTVCYYF